METLFMNTENRKTNDHTNVFLTSEEVSQTCSVQKVFLGISQNSQENTCVRVFFKKETLAQVFCCEFCQISKNTCFTEHLWWLLLFVLNLS